MMVARARRKTSTRSAAPPLHPRVLPVLLTGDEESSFPPLIQSRVYADFREDKAYFTTAFDLILSLYEIDFRNRAVADLRESLRKSRV